MYMRQSMPYREVCKVKSKAEWVSSVTKGSHATSAVGAGGPESPPRPTYSTRAKSTRGSSGSKKAGGFFFSTAASPPAVGSMGALVATRQYNSATQSLERLELDLDVVAEANQLSTNEAFVLKRLIFNLLLLEPSVCYSRCVLTNHARINI